MGRNETGNKLISKLDECYLTAWSERDGSWNAEFEGSDGKKSRTKMGDSYGDIVRWGLEQKRLDDRRRRITTARQI